MNRAPTIRDGRDSDSAAIIRSHQARALDDLSQSTEFHYAKALAHPSAMAPSRRSA
jgi:hypothetical protein